LSMSCPSCSSLFRLVIFFADVLLAE
jgi:hypothetical protein